MSQNSGKRHCSTSTYGTGTWSVPLVGETDIDEDEFSFVWTVRHYSVVSQLGSLVKSPVFHGGPKFNHAWKMELRPKEKVENVEYLSLYLHLVDCGDGHHRHSKAEVVKANYQFAILNAEGQPSNIRGKTPGASEEVLEFKLLKPEDGSSGYWGYNKFIESAVLIDPNWKLVVEDTLMVLCKIWICGGLKETPGNSKDGTNLSKSNPSMKKRMVMAREKMTMDIGKLFRDPVGSDVTISTKAQLIKAHKAILMARSSVFTAILKNTDVLLVKIIDFDDETVEGMIEYVYTGETKWMAQRARELFMIAEKYDLTGLTEDCEYQLVDDLNNENAAEIFVLAHKHNAPYLKHRSIDFINKNKEELFKSQTFCEVMKSQADTGIFIELFFSQR